MDQSRTRARDTAALKALHAPDSYGVPPNLLGPHPEKVVEAVGRIVTLSALLEDRQRSLLLRLTGARPGDLRGP